MFISECVTRCTTSLAPRSGSSASSLLSSRTPDGTAARYKRVRLYDFTAARYEGPGYIMLLLQGTKELGNMIIHLFVRLSVTKELGYMIVQEKKGKVLVHLPGKRD